MLDKFKGFFSGYQATGAVEYIVAGLGNPGKEYENTRHNMGFIAVDYISEKLGFTMKRLKFKALCADATLAGKRVLFIKPSTYMNLSGESVRDAMSFYKVPIENVIVISDDVSLAVGKMRIRRSGSDGGQKGLRSIIYLTGKDTFPRIRIGVGEKPYPGMELADWVLSRMTKDEAKKLEIVLKDVYETVELIVGGQMDAAMNKFN